MDSELPINTFIKTSQNLTEDEVRAELKKMAINETGIDALIKRARENPR
jgi:SOS response regulatory protein OraA/RecX